MAGTLNEYLKLSARTGTFVSLDVVNSTLLKRGESEEDVIYTFLSYHRLVSDAAYQLHGTVMTISGDGIMCRFDKPDDAAAAAYALLQALPEFNKRQNRLHQAFTFRIGVHTGEVMESEGLSSGQIVSETIDIAAKLQQAAQPGHARFSEITYTQLAQKPPTLLRVGWDGRLNMNVYEYRDTRMAAPVQRHTPNPLKVLVIDQELDEVVRLRHLLQERKHETFVVFDAPQANFCIQQWKPHVIFLSADLPWNSGWELLKTLRSGTSCSSTPILMVSSNTSGKAVERCFQLGGNGCLSKPLEEQQSMKRLEMVLREFYA